MNNQSSYAQFNEARPNGRGVLASLLLRQQRLATRFLAAYAHLRQRPRGWRRRWQRRTAVTLAGVALLLALSRAPVRALDITVDDGAVDVAVDSACSLSEAIINANDGGQTHAECDPGSGGADTIILPAGGSFTITQSFATYYEGNTGLPLISSEITIEGNNATIERDTADLDKFRLLAVSTSGDLTLNDATLSGGYAYRHIPAPYNPGYYYYYGDDGAIFNAGTLTLSNSTLSNNTARYFGGGVYNDDSTMTSSTSTFNDNTARADGGAIYSDFSGTLTISDSTFDTNYSGDDGGAIANGNTLTISGSSFSGNSADFRGGAIYANDGTATITNTAFSGNFTIDDDSGALYNDNAETEISGSTFSGNTASRNGGAIYNRDVLLISNSTLSSNSAEEGGGVYNDGTVTITNSTISGNSAVYEGGGVYNDFGTVTITNSTITANTASTEDGGGLYQFSGTTTLSRTLISGNSVAESGREVYIQGGTINVNDYNLFGYSDDAGVYGFIPGGTDIVPTESLAAILDTTLADNGGPTETHALVEGSPAIDRAPSADCTAAPVNGEDQRGEPRNVDGLGNGNPANKECDIGAFELQPPAAAVIYMTAAGPGMTDDGVNFGKEDILQWDGSQWSKFFDGTDEGLTTGHDINAIHVEAADNLYISFFQNKIMTADAGNVFGHDILHFDGDEFSFYFDGSDVGLTTVSEKVDALHILDGSESPIGSGCDAYLLISTLGTGKVPAFGGGMLNFQGEDILGFCLTNSGSATAGVWHLVLNGSAAGMPKNSTDSISASDDGDVIYLTTKGTFNVDSATGGHSMVYKFESGSFSGPFFSAPAEGLDEKVDGLHVEGDLP